MLFNYLKLEVEYWEVCKMMDDLMFDYGFGNVEWLEIEWLNCIVWGDILLLRFIYMGYYCEFVSNFFRGLVLVSLVCIGELLVVICYL